ncbi:MAG: N-acetyltransferase [Bacteroidales bacterium]|nr:N-acetyltransferase [Bacteroidales bacterium]
MNRNYIIRLECESDYRTVENLTREAFWNIYQPGCTEHYVLHCYRSNPDFIPELDFVMEVEGSIIGHVMFSKAEIISDDGRSIPILTFGPISISPAYKRMGYGIALLRHALSKARELGYGAVFMEGNIDFYRHAGFVLASNLSIHYHAEPRESEVPYFLGQELKDGYLSGIEGTYHTPIGYYAAFDDPDGFEKYESGFPYKEKLVLPGQLQ